MRNHLTDSQLQFGRRGGEDIADQERDYADGGERNGDIPHTPVARLGSQAHGWRVSKTVDVLQPLEPSPQLLSPD
jgi:hypothetical protein